jgi:hypothetical protein
MEGYNLIKKFKQLPNNLAYEICLYTGKFILRYDKKLNKTVLVSIIDFTEQQWIQFNLIFFKLFNKRKFNISEDFGTRVAVSISRNGDLMSCINLTVRLPPILIGNNHNTLYTQIIPKNKKRRPKNKKGKKSN